MSTIIVEITTDHTDDEHAVKSVQNAMKRAGYDLVDHEMGEFGVVAQYGPLSSGRHAFVQVAEPEVTRNAARY